MKHFFKKGQIFGRLTVIKELPVTNHVREILCKCSCGKNKEVRAIALITKNTQSCGCYRKDSLHARNTTHGYSKSIEYASWINMRERCLTPKHKSYHNYGGRGIKVSPKWINSFENFIKDMGNKPSKNYSLERINVNKNYCKSNCKWATIEEQAKNKRRTLKYMYKGKLTPLIDISKKVGLSYNIINGRLHRGQSINNAIRKVNLKIQK